MTGWTRRAMRVPEHHAAAEGHFPGRPVVPGALLLDEVAALLGGTGALTFRAVKFLAPVRYGEWLEIRWQSGEDGCCRFEITGAEGSASMLAGTIAGAA